MEINLYDQRRQAHLNDGQPVTKARLQQRDQARHEEDGLDDLQQTGQHKLEHAKPGL
jgi:hypothetical protein